MDHEKNHRFPEVGGNMDKLTELGGKILSL